MKTIVSNMGNEFDETELVDGIKATNMLLETDEIKNHPDSIMVPALTRTRNHLMNLLDRIRA